MNRHVLITGGTRGIGFGLAKAFAGKGLTVSITGRTEDGIRKAVAGLKTLSGSDNIQGFVFNITNAGEPEQLWKDASGVQPIDIWINNAGTGHGTYPFIELDDEKIRQVLRTNLEGTMLTTRYVLTEMIRQGYGQIWQMEGFGSDGRIMEGMSVYGTSKNALHYFNRSLILENRTGPVQIGTLRPGMVVTELLTGPVKEDRPINKSAIRIFNLLADEADTVCPWLVEKILRTGHHGAGISWLTGRKIMFRFLMNIFKKRRLPSLSGLS